MAEQVIIVEDVGGNLHDAARFANQFGLAANVVCMQGFPSGSNTNLVLRLPVNHPYLKRYHPKLYKEVP